MKIRQKIFRSTGVGILGFLVTAVVWYGCIQLDRVFALPRLDPAQWFKNILLIIFSADLLYLFVGSVVHRMRSGWGKTLTMTGPYQFVRHPIYSGIIYSLTGLLAVLQTSWTLLFSVLPISIFWSWLVEKEEQTLVRRFGNEYLRYQTRTGQFFPSLSALKNSSDQSPQP